MSGQIKDLRSELTRQELEKEIELDTSRTELSNTIEERDWLADIVNESDTVTFFESLRASIIMNYENNVTPAIESVLKLVGKKCEKLSARSTILNMNVERLVLSQKQLSEVIPNKSNLTLYTDETSKFGVKYSGYHVSDEEGTMFVLGMRQLETKSAQYTLNVFQNILADIEERSEEANHTAKNILLKILATMSDRASTEFFFNKLLEELRSEVLPELVENWNELSPAEQTSVSTLLNFFCGLHSLVHFAETCNASLIELKNANFNNEAPIFDKSFFKKSESGAARLIRTACKALARGADEKSGKFNDFNLYMKQVLKENDMKSIPLEEFHGNRFNILFESATGVFFMKDKIQEFLNGNQTNKLLKAVLHDIKVPWYLSEVKALGLISKLITVPLWCLLEDKTVHILDMNKHYLELVNFFDEALNDIPSFMKGTILPFGEKTVVKQDPLMESLLADWEYDDKVAVCLNVMLSALSQLSKRIFADHLPGGCWENVTDEMRQRTSGAAKHNKFAESIFGYLDTLLRMKPNVSALASEAFVMFSANKTKQWLERKTDFDKNSLIQDAMKNVSLVRANYKRRKEEIEANHRRKVEESIREAEAIEYRRLNRLEGYTQKMIYYGLWQTEDEVDSALKEISTKKETMEALKAQLNFRKHVLKQDPKNKENLYLLSKKVDNVKCMLTVDELASNIKKLVRHAFSIDKCHDPNPDLPILTSKTVSHRFIEDGESRWWKGKVISQVPGYPEYFNITYDGDTSVYVYRLLEDYRTGDLKVLVQ
ncbi:SPIN3-like protein [Mya arenaria]|uniref:SPIN3-like protein n=1 Tax=Mya arenaria TaxID=6604 RepID=A0ABY7EW40_MYAAR|nr:SPIN3-like protein [Mya arenaria]